MDARPILQTMAASLLWVAVLSPTSAGAYDFNLRDFFKRTAKIIGPDDQAIYCGEASDAARRDLLAELDAIAAEARDASEAALANLSADRERAVKSFSETASKLEARVTGAEPPAELEPINKEWDRMKLEMNTIIPASSDSAARKRILEELGRVEGTVAEARRGVNVVYDNCKPLPPEGDSRD